VNDEEEKQLPNEAARHFEKPPRNILGRTAIYKIFGVVAVPSSRMAISAP
jgi:hypothetical protein